MIPENIDFISWWFDEHYIISTLITPGFTLAWCGFKGLIMRGIISLLVWGIITSN
jgi:hypothetical protein